MWLMNHDDRHQVLFAIFLLAYHEQCYAISNTNFNANIRAYSVVEDANSTNVKTLQKEDIGSHGGFLPVSGPIKFQEVSDSVLSSSSRGLLHYDHPGYGFSEYEENPHYGHGYEYQTHNTDHHDHSNHNNYHDHPEPHEYHHHGHHGLDHHDSDHHHGLQYGHGYHHKHYDHALGAKTILWPIAGIALLGAAAALVSNPILLQLGVVSGRRKRRDTESSGPDFITKALQQPILYKHNVDEEFDAYNKNNENVNRKLLSRDELKIVKRKIAVKNIKQTTARVTDVSESHENYDGTRRFIPIPLLIRDNY